MVVAGVKVAKITPGAAFAEKIGLMNLMNPAFREPAVIIGLADGVAAAGEVRALLG